VTEYLFEFRLKSSSPFQLYKRVRRVVNDKGYCIRNRVSWKRVQVTSWINWPIDNILLLYFLNNEILRRQLDCIVSFVHETCNEYLLLRTINLKLIYLRHTTNLHAFVLLDYMAGIDYKIILLLCWSLKHPTYVQSQFENVRYAL